MATIEMGQTIATLAHHGVMRVDNEPYIHHPLRVSRMIAKIFPDKEDWIIGGILHDVVEDSQYTIETLQLMGFSTEVLEIVKLMSRDKSMSKNAYYKALLECDHKGAQVVKFFDALDNSTWTYNSTTHEFGDRWMTNRVKYRKLVMDLYDVLEDLLGPHLKHRIFYVWNQLDLKSMEQLLRVSNGRQPTNDTLRPIGNTSIYKAVMDDRSESSETLLDILSSLDAA